MLVPVCSLAFPAVPKASARPFFARSSGIAAPPGIAFALLIFGFA
jgi:hypothetical protein